MPSGRVSAAEAAHDQTSSKAGRQRSSSSTPQQDLAMPAVRMVQLAPQDGGRGAHLHGLRRPGPSRVPARRRYCPHPACSAPQRTHRSGREIQSGPRGGPGCASCYHASGGPYGTCSWSAALRWIAWSRRSYLPVVATEACPAIFWTVARSTPASSRSPVQVRRSHGERGAGCRPRDRAP